MKTVAGVFTLRTKAERTADRITWIGIPRDRVTVLFPGESRAEVESAVRISPAEQPGMGKAIGGLVGTAAGAATGVELGAAVTAVIPGVGPVIAMGILGAAVLGAFGATIGGRMDTAITEGLPEDELFVYEDALRKGRSIVLAFADNDKAAERAREIMEEEGAESIDAARKQWWIGLRPAEEQHYQASGGSFQPVEDFYKLGFESAIHARNRCKQYDQMLNEMAADLEELKKQYPDAEVEESFRRGFERGREYYASICNQTNKAA